MMVASPGGFGMVTGQLNEPDDVLAQVTEASRSEVVTPLLSMTLILRDRAKCR